MFFGTKTQIKYYNNNNIFLVGQSKSAHFLDKDVSMYISESFIHEKGLFLINNQGRTLN